MSRESKLKRKQKCSRALRNPQGFGFVLVALLIMSGLMGACQPDIFSPPRLETATAQKQSPPTLTPEPLFLPAATATPSARLPDEPLPSAGTHPSLTIWINETAEEHERVLQAMMADFEQQSQVEVQLLLVSPDLMPKLMETAVLSDTMPDVVLHPIAYTIGWAERNILDAAASDEILEQIGRDTFDPAALELVEFNGLSAALPSDGYQQLLIYRSDWLEELGLPPPDDYASMLAAAEAIFDSEAIVSGLVVPTEANLVTTQHAFEQIAAANGCELIDGKGEVLILEPACQEALDFYYTIINQYSPIGVQTDASAQDAYFGGRTGMIIGTPSILPKLAGLDEAALPYCPECAESADFLAENSGLLTHLRGLAPSAGGANFGEIVVLGITHVADTEAATAFAHFWFNEAYPWWLEVESERKVPMRWGVESEPRQFIDAWGTTPMSGSERTLADIYGPAMVAELREGVASSSRWALRQGQGALLTKMYEEFTLPIVLQEMLSGYFNSNQTLLEIYSRTTDLIPNYEYYKVNEESVDSP